MTRYLLGLMGLGIVLFAACADHPPAPIEDRNAVAAPVKQNRTATTSSSIVADKKVAATSSPPLRPGVPYRVEKGDTLYSIAFRLGIDFRRLAAVNGIESPYVINPGAILTTDLSKTRKTSVAAKPAPQPAARPSPPKPVKSAPPVAKTPAPLPSSTPARTVSPVTAVKLGPVSTWRWPTNGGVQRTFSNNLHKGIDIGGARGAPVRATAPGVVVYAGTGLSGYGALLIIKHNERFLSAYGHNDAMLVKEGDGVREGQQIARMGSTGTDSVKLHFEIRQDGKPVNPLKLLPAR
ncbi:peptidase M23B [Luminiphilus syltensis NOR5-1B]|uniref:Peptidase M23B n=1 Tax=Luminiphilus syltensis NOR5-1B TaxID=565045 RepID=B8KSK2_9GAMM|nr:peptidoglycan DD-metalloendopeptidase family protein [Luminiphilus syltensis]EED35891.1 peptidase M23B [Luminiphilus syltensis NOR5-1B]